MPEALAIPLAEAAFGEVAGGALLGEGLLGAGAFDLAGSAGLEAAFGIGAGIDSGLVGGGLGAFGGGGFEGAISAAGEGAGPAGVTENWGVNELSNFANPQNAMTQSFPGISTPGSSGAFMGPGGLPVLSPTDAIMNGQSGMSGSTFQGGDGTQSPAPVSEGSFSLTPSGQFQQLAKGIFGNIGGGTNVAGMNMGVSPFDIGKGLYGLMQSDEQKKLAARYAAQADPNAAYRPGYAAQLSTLAGDPSSIYKLPGWQAGNEAVQRSMAAQGYQGSGNMAVALQKYGQDFYNQALNQYGSLSGIGFNPASAGQIGIQGNADAINLAGQSLNSLGYGGAGGAGPRLDPATLAMLLKQGGGSSAGASF